MTEQSLWRKCFGQTFYSQHIFTADDLRFQFNMHIGLHFGRTLQNFDLIKHFLTALGAFDGFFTIEGLQLCNDFLLVFDLTLLIQIGLHLCFSEHSFFLSISRIVSGKSGDISLIDLHDLGNDPVQEIPVMGYDDNCSLIIHKKCLQPCDRIHIQMVGRLIKHNNIRAGEKKLS